jgi:hypothetical protein
VSIKIVAKGVDGEIYDLPIDRVNDAVSQGFEIDKSQKIPMKDRKGEVYDIPFSHYDTAKRQGFEVHDANAMGKVESFGRGVLKGGTLGFNDEITGAVESLFTDKTYEQARDESRAADKKAAEDNPKTYMGGNIAGGVATAFVPGLNAAKGATLAAKIGKGALAGGIDALGASDAENFSGQQLKDVGVGLSVGGVAPWAIEGAGKVASKVAGGAGDTLKKGSKWAGQKLGISKAALDEYGDNPKLYNEWAAKAEKEAPSTGNKFNDAVTDPKTRYVQGKVQEKLAPLYKEIADKEEQYLAAKEAQATAKGAYGEASDQVRRARGEELQRLQGELQSANARLRDEMNAAKELDTGVVDQVDNLFKKVKEKNQEAADIQKQFLKDTDYVEVSAPLTRFENSIDEMISSSDRAKLKAILEDIKRKTDGDYGMTALDARKSRAYAQGQIDWDSVKREGYSDEATRALETLQREMNDAIDNTIGDETYKQFRGQYSQFLETAKQAREAIGRDRYSGIKRVMSDPSKQEKLQALENALNQKNENLKKIGKGNNEDPFSVIQDPRVRKYMQAKYMSESDKLNQFKGLPEQQAFDAARNVDIKGQLKGLPERQAMLDAEKAAIEAKQGFKAAKTNVGPITEKNANAMIDRYSRLGDTAKNSGAKDAFSGLGPEMVDDMNKYAVNRAFDSSRPNGSRLVQLGSNMLPGPLKPLGALAGFAADYSGGKMVKGALNIGDVMQKAGPKYAKVLQDAFDRGGEKSFILTHTLLMQNYSDYFDKMSGGKNDTQAVN